MTMNITQQIITIDMVVLGTMLTRFLPFIVFPSGKPTPKYIQYLGKVLPSAVIGFLVIYCFKDVRLLSGSHAIPEFLGVTVVVLLHFWKKHVSLDSCGNDSLHVISQYSSLPYRLGASPFSSFTNGLNVHPSPEYSLLRLRRSTHLHAVELRPILE